MKSPAFDANYPPCSSACKYAVLVYLPVDLLRVTEQSREPEAPA